MFGLSRKGQITVGFDADLVIFDSERQVTLSTATLHENVDWTPYEGLEVKGWPATTISRGQVIVEDEEFKRFAKMKIRINYNSFFHIYHHNLNLFNPLRYWQILYHRMP
jgi:hypothetical protein